MESISDGSEVCIADLKEFIRLTNERDELRERVKGIENRRAVLEARLVEAYALAGMQSINIDGATIYRNARKFASLNQEQRSAAVEAARQLGLDDLITLQPQRFSAWCQEQYEQHGELPPQLAGMVNVFDKLSLGIRRS